MQAVIDARMQAIQGMGTLIVPAPALAEYLQKIDPADRPRVASDVSAFASVLPFDYPASVHAAGLFMKPTRGNITKQAFKVDAMILAVAIAQRATTLIVKDGDFASFPQTGVHILDVKDLKIQTNLPFPP